MLELHVPSVIFGIIIGILAIPTVVAFTSMARYKAERSKSADE